MSEQTNDPSSSSQQEKEMEEKTRKDLFRLAMQGKWNDVLGLYKENTRVQVQMLTRAKDTTLHVAISAGDEDNVLKLLRAIGKEDEKAILEVQNDSGSTPLHLAAALGMERACWEMASRHPDLLTTKRNKNGETPLFTAVRHGREKAFFALEYSMQNPPKGGQPAQTAGQLDLEKRDVTHCRREKDGNNILHSAILGEYFGLANEIIKLYPSLVGLVNARGESPLHSLAKKPSCFKSGTYFNIFDEVIYYCIFVSPLGYNYPNYKCPQIEKQGQQLQLDKPMTFLACSHVFDLLRKSLPVVVHRLYECLHRRSAKKDEDDDSVAVYCRECAKEDVEDPRSKSNKKVPEIYDVGIEFLKVVMKFLLIILGIGLWRMQTLERKKRKNEYACQILDNLIQLYKGWEYQGDGMNPRISENDSNSVAHLSAPPPETSTDANSPPHGDSSIEKGKDEQNQKGEASKEPDKGWIRMEITLYIMPVSSAKGFLGILLGTALQMQWEIKWYKYVLQSMDVEFFGTYNNCGQTAQELFTATHKNLVKDAGDWLFKTSESCSVVAALLAGVSFASAATVPGGLNQNTGFPIFSFEIPFQIFALSALVALCFSITSLITFLTILTSRYQEKDFERNLPTKLIFGLTFLFAGIAAMLVSFCAGDFFVVEGRLKHAAYPIFAVMCLPVSFFAIERFPLYFDLVCATLAAMPERTQKTQAF